IPDDERIWIRDFGLGYDHHNDNFIYLKTAAQQEDALEASEAACWYRTMSKEDFSSLLERREVPQKSDYWGIATNREYAKGYLTNTSPASCLVEFDTGGAGRLFQLFQENGIQIKAEGGGGTFGLGDKGTQDKRAKAKS